jgi:SAM-dependent methyltransferase
MPDRATVIVALMLTLTVGAGLLARQPSQSPSLAPYVATPPDVVERMLTLARTDRSDVVYDIGCGDGRVVIAAAQKYGARGVGIDIDAGLIAKARAAAEAAGVSKLVSFRVQDAMTVDVSEATVVTLYLLAASNAKLRPIITARLRPGARIVAHNYPLGGGWEPEVVDNFTDAAGTMRTLYLWTADGKVH